MLKSIVLWTAPLPDSLPSVLPASRRSAPAARPKRASSLVPASRPSLTGEKLVATIREVTAAEARPGASSFNAESLRANNGPFILKTENGMELQGELAVPSGAGRHPAVLLLVPDSMRGDNLIARTNKAEFDALAATGRVVLAITPRPSPPGTEEMKSPLLGPFYFLGLRADLVGRTLLGLRMDDVIRATDYLAARADVDPSQITAVASGHMGLVLLHAAALDARLQHIAIDHVLASYRSLLEAPLPIGAPEDVLPGVLLRYDIPDLAKFLGDRLTETSSLDGSEDLSQSSTPPNVPSNSEIKVRRSALIEPIGCNDIHLEGFSTSYYGMWSVHPTCCENLHIRNLTIRSTGGNGDGIDVDSCKHVQIDGCDISTGDDCISLKSGRGREGYLLHRATEDVHISNCTFADSLFACIGIGSETSGGIRDVRIEHCKFTGAKTFALYIKSRPGRGAFIEDISANDLEVSGTEGGLIRFNLLASGKQDESPVPGREGIPTVRNFRFSNIRVTGAPILVDGTSVHPEKPLEGFSLTNVTGSCAKGIYLANVRKAEIRNINVTGYAGPLLNINNVTGNGLQGAAAIAVPDMGEPVPAPVEPYHLH